MRPEVRAALIAGLLIALFLLPSCGRKGMPTVKTFEKPAPVQQAKAFHRGDELIISWEYPRDQRQKISGFRIGKTEEDSGVTREAEVLPQDAAEFADRDFEPGKRYTYFILPVNRRGIPSDEAVSLSVSPRRLPPPPAGLTFSPRSEALELRWTPVDVALQKVRYNVYKSAKMGEYGRTPVNPKPLGEPLFTDTLDMNAKVYYTVRSLLDTETGDEGRPSAEITVNPETFVPSPPSGLQFVPSPDDVVLMWQGNPEAWVGGYRIYRQREGEKGFTRVGGSITPAFRDPGTVKVKTRYYITAEGPGQESRPSPVVETMPLQER